MSRSRKKNPYHGNTGDRSQKFEKRQSHKSLRQAERRAILEDREVTRKLREVSNTWGWRKDGKHRFDPTERSDLMRK